MAAAEPVGVDQRVRVLTGPYRDFIGTVIAVDVDQDTLLIETSFFGRNTQLSLTRQDVEIAGGWNRG